MNNSIMKQLLAVQKLSREELKEKYEELFGREAPPGNSVTLKKKLAYRIQEIHFGGLTKGEQGILERLAKSDPMALTERVKPIPGQVAAGTRFSRLWRGKVYEVVATADGKYEYENLLYTSLSAVAKEITGTRWNGRLFFGLERQ